MNAKYSFNYLHSYAMLKKGALLVGYTYLELFVFSVVFLQSKHKSFLLKFRRKT